jgi:thiamine-phosphate pyrophosphorylase
MAERCLLYYITDRTQFPGDGPTRRRKLLAKIAEAARAGVDYIQLREKDLSARELECLAKEAIAVIHQQLATSDQRPATRLLINSRTDVALAAGADGVHLRSGDISPNDVQVAIRRSGHWPLTTDHFLIAVSCHTPPDVLRAASDGADFAVFAPVFEKRIVEQSTFQKNAHLEITRDGLAALRQACQAKIPVLALGGVTLQNAPSCREAGSAGIGAIRLFQENNIEDVVRALRSS